MTQNISSLVNNLSFVLLLSPRVTNEYHQQTVEKMMINFQIINYFYGNHASFSLRKKLKREFQT